MVRIVELVGLLAPVIGGILVVRYRRRSRAAAALGIVACILGVGASVVGVAGLRLSIGAAYVEDEGVAGVLHHLDVWAALRLGLMVTAGLFLTIAALVDRTEERPVGWIATGLVLMAAGIALHLAEVDLGAEHERLTAILAVLLEVAQSGALGVGFLALCVASVAYRGGDDGKGEPVELARRAGAVAWRVYSGSRQRSSE